MAKPKNKESEILSAAIEVFLEKGYSSTSIQDIANRAGIGKGTIYEYFRCKDELFIRSIKFDIMNIVSQIKSKISVEDGFLARLNKLVNSVQEVLSENFGRLEYFFISNVSTLNPEVLKEFKNMIEAAKDEITSITSEALNQGIAEGKIREDIDLNFVAHAIGGMIAVHCEQCHSRDYSEEQRSDKNAKLIKLIMNGIEHRAC